MSIERIYFRKEKFILTLIYGKLTNTEIGEHVMEMNNELATCTGLIELADCRFLTDISELNSEGLAFAASMEKGHPRTLGGKGAIVVSSEEVFDLARVYASIAAVARDDSQVFRNLDTAIGWLEVSPLRDKILAHCTRIENSRDLLSKKLAA